jgi:hypothetical protein
VLCGIPTGVAVDTEEKGTERTGQGNRFTNESMSPEFEPLFTYVGRSATIGPKFLSATLVATAASEQFSITRALHGT